MKINNCNFSRIAVAKTKESVIDLFTSAKNYTKLVLKNSYTQQQQHTTDSHINYYQIWFLLNCWVNPS